ncbi:hypothetical protein CRUP_014022 [Coryphaenoides rupestris]|nr:hypothetical protein CRUP_014022 [Coryphaenoides rupestris]
MEAVVSWATALLPVNLYPESHHTLVLGSSGRIWTFGSGVKGQSGSEASTPALVQLPWATDGAAAPPKDLKIAAGWNTNFLYSSCTQSLEREFDETIGRFNETKLQRWKAMTEGDDNAGNAVDGCYEFKPCYYFRKTQAVCIHDRGIHC